MANVKYNSTFAYNNINTEDRIMKKIATVTLSAAILLSSCGVGNDNTSAGVFMGAQIGSILGSAIGGISGGPRDSDIGTIVGMASGAIAGAAIGNAADKADQRKYEEYKRQRQSRSASYEGNDYNNNVGYDAQDSGFDSDNKGDDVIDFNGSDTAGTNNSGGDIKTSVPNTMRIDDFAAVSPKLELRSVRFVNSEDDMSLRRGETAKIVVEIYNNSSDFVYGVQPIVKEQTGNKHIFVSSPILVEKISPGKGIRYTAMVKADKRIKDGEVQFAVSAKENAGQRSTETKLLTVQTIK